MDRSMALRRDLADALTIILDASRGRNVCPARFFCRPPRAASNSPAIGRLRPPFVSSPLQASNANGLIADRIATRNFHYPKKWDRCHQQTSPHRTRPRRQNPGLQSMNLGSRAGDRVGWNLRRVGQWQIQGRSLRNLRGAGCRGPSEPDESGSKDRGDRVSVPTTGTLRLERS